MSKVIVQSELEKTFGGLNSSKTSGNKRTAKRLVRNKSAIQDLQKSLNDNPRFGKMVEYSVGCLKNMAVDQVCVEELIEEGVLETLMKIQKLNPYNENVHRIVNECIAAFCLNEEMARLVAERIGPDNILFSCKKHVEPETLAASCNAMAKMMRTVDENVEMFVKAEAIDALDHVAATMNQQPEVMAKVAECVRCITRIPQYIPAVLNTDILKNILIALRNNPENSNLVESALAFLASIAAVDGPHIAMLRDMGIVDLLVSTLELHADNKVILRLGAEALRYLAGSDDLLNALRVRIGLNNETANALAKLAGLMLVEENIDKMIDAKGIQWLIEAIKTATAAPPSETSYKILVSGCRALDRICADEKKIYSVMQAGGVPTVLAVVAQHGTDENVLVAALHAIARMITRKENAEFLCKARVMNAVEQARKAFASSARVGNPCSDILERLSRHPSLHQHLVDSRAVDMLNDLLRTFKDNEDIVKMVLRALKNLSSCPAAVQRMMDLDMGKLISEIVKKYENNPEVVGLAIDYLAAMAQGHPAAAEYLKSCGVLKAVLQALDKLRDDARLQAQGADLMKLLSGENQVKDAVASVWSVAQHMIKNPATREQVAAKLLDATALLKNLAQVEANHGQLTQHNAQAAFLSAIQAALELPESHQLRAQILEDATRGLQSLTEHNGGDLNVANQLIKNGQLFTLLQAILNNPDEGLAEIALNLLATVSQHPALHQALIDAGAVGYAVKISKLFPYNETVQTSSAMILGNLAYNQQAAAQLVQAGGAQTIIDALFTNITNKGELVQALDILRKIAADPEIAQALWNSGVLDALLAIWKKHENDPQIVDSCLQALISLLVSEEIALEMGTKGVCQLAIPAIRTHYRQPVLIESDVILLDSLSSAEPNAQLLLNPEYATIDLMRWVTKKFKDRPTTVESALRLIATLESLNARLESERLARQAEAYKVDESSVHELFTNMLTTQKPDELVAMFQQLEMLMTNPDVVKMLALNGGLHSMSKLMLANIQNESTFKSASSLYVRMCCAHLDDDINQLIQGDLTLLRSHSEVIKPHPHFATAVAPADIIATSIGLGLLSLNSDAYTTLYDCEGLAALSKVLATNTNEDAIRESARVLSKASSQPTILQQLVPHMRVGSNNFATIRDLIDAIRKHITNYDFVRFGIYLLGNLATNEDVKTEIGIQSGIQLILQAITTHPNELPLIKNCFYSLASLTYHHQINCTFVMASQGIGLTLRTIQSHQTLPDLLDSALCVLCNMCHNNDLNKTLIINENGAHIVVDTILNNFDQVDVLLSAFRMLGSIAYNAATVDSIVKVGGVQGIVAGMTVLADNIDVVDVAIRVLTNLASNCTEEHMKIMAEEGAVQAIVEVAQQHTANIDIELSAMTALCNLSIMHYNADLIIKQGGVEVTIASLQSLGYDSEYAEMAIRLLFNLTYSINNLNRIIDAGLATAVLRTLKNLMSNQGVISIGLRCISNLCYSDDVAIRIASEGPIEFILSLLQYNISSPQKDSSSIIGESLNCLSTLCRAEVNALAMSTQSIHLCIKAMQGMCSDSILIQNISRYLANLFVHPPAAIGAAETSVIPQLLSTISFHINNVEVLLVGLKPMENMAYAAQSVRDYLKDNKVLDKMDEVKKANTDRADVIEMANNVIYAINRTDFIGDNLDFVELNRGRKNLKDVYDVLGEKKEEILPDKITDIPPKIRNFLTAGALIMKHSMTAPPRPRHVYVTDDLKFICWKDPKKNVVDPDTRMKIFRIRSVERGRCTEQLQRQRFGKFLADEKCAFSIQFRDRTLDLEAPTEKDREKWVNAIENLIAYKRGLQAQNQSGASFYDK